MNMNPSDYLFLCDIIHTLIITTFSDFPHGGEYDLHKPPEVRRLTGSG
jgi:hypothetical protein